MHAWGYAMMWRSTGCSRWLAQAGVPCWLWEVRPPLPIQVSPSDRPIMPGCCRLDRHRD